eukprot:jgi/Mesvir1/22442/Mv17912-RA.3
MWHFSSLYPHPFPGHPPSRAPSTLFTDLSPNTGGVVRYKQLTDGFVVQFLNVTSYNSNLVNTFESRFSWNGTIDLSWFNCAPTGPTTVGLSNKGGSSELRTLVNISALAVCPGVTLAPRPGSNPSPFTCTRSLATPPVNLTKELFPEKVRGLYPTADTPAPSSGPTVKPAPGDVTKDMSTRIVGGTTVTNRTAYPFMAVILDQAGNHVCGGSLISRKYVLTAAHCASASYQVALNTLNLAPFDSTVQVRAIVNRYVHPDYDENTIDNDLAVMEIESFVSDNFIFIRTNMTRYETPGTMMRVIGWGHSAGVIGPDGSGTVEEKRLQQVDLPVISWADCTYPASCGSAACQVGYPEYWVTNETMICAGYAAGGKDPCFGDSGGPMFTATPPYVQVGIVSWGEGCALPNRFGVFTRISKYVTWLRQFIDDAVFNCNAYKPGEDGVSSPPPPSPPPPSPPPPSPPPPSPPSASDVTVLDAYTEMKALAVRDGQGGSSSFNAAERALLALYRRMQVAVDDPISAKTPSTDQLLLDLYRRMQELD